MANTLTTVRSNLRIDLQDDGATQLWTDAQLNRHIARAVAEYQQAAPRITSTTKNGDGTTRRFDVSAQTGYLSTERIEHPVDEDPPAYLPFREETKGILYVLAEDPPETGTNNVKVWYARTHTLDASTTTIPDEHEEIILLGASAFATLAYGRLAVSQVNPSIWTPQRAREWAGERLAEFRARLAQLAAERATPTRTVQWGDIQAEWGTL